jgi:hypothetical protein
MQMARIRSLSMPAILACCNLCKKELQDYT